MLDWQSLTKIHVIKRLKSVVGKWWNVQLNFTDAKGLLQGVPDGKFFNPLNEICQKVVATEEGFQRCVKTSREITVDAMHRRTPKIYLDHMGFAGVSVPVRNGNKFIGCVFADGFIIEENVDKALARIRQNIRTHYPKIDDEWVEQYLADYPRMKQSDVDYLVELIEVVVEEMVSMKRTIAEKDSQVKNLTRELRVRYSFSSMIGKSAPMQKIYSLLEKVCSVDSTILINGANGTGKELVARAIHYNGRRKKMPFVVQNCSAYNDNLLDSALFGYVKGAFTGAQANTKGIFEAADKGTLFLDEVGDTSPAMQVKLLRVLQEGTFIPVGGTETKKVNVRIVAATNKNLAEMINRGEFREDLFYRLNVINIVMPSLNERVEDIPLLVEHFMALQAEKLGGDALKLADGMMTSLMNYPWPGNVRELQNEIERICVLATDGLVTEDLFAPKILQSQTSIRKSSVQTTGVKRKLKESLEELERELIYEGLLRTNWNKSQLARELGISRAGLIMKVEKYELDKRT